MSIHPFAELKSVVSIIHLMQFSGGMTTSRPHAVNSNVSSSGTGITMDQRVEVAVLSIRLPKRLHGNFAAPVWQYFGELCCPQSDIDDSETPSTSSSASNSSRTDSQLVIDKSHRFCRLCLKREQDLYSQANTRDSSGKKGHISRVAKYGLSTATGTMADHLLTMHDVDVRNIRYGSTACARRQMSLEQSLSMTAKGRTKRPAANEYEFNRDLCMMLCVDLLPFDTVTGKGFSSFFEKNLPGKELPSESTMRRSALYDLYRTLKASVKEQLIEVAQAGGSFCLMFDGWTDKYYGRPYLGLRVSYIAPDTCIAHIKTLSVKVVESHKSDQLANHIRSELDDFGLTRGTPIFSTHDGARNMFKCSELLEVQSATHCVAHSIHLLLTVDSVFKIRGMGDLLKKCKSIVTTLHFKSCILWDESSTMADKEVMDDLMEKIAEVRKYIEVDERFGDDAMDELEEQNADEPEDMPVTTHHTDASAGNMTIAFGDRRRHTTLKQSMPTRWNATLVMVESILDNEVQINRALMVTGNRELTISSMEKTQLQDLRTFLKPFENFTKLVSGSVPHLGLVTLIRHEIQQISKVNDRDSAFLKDVKRLVAAKLDTRVPETEMTRLATLLDPSMSSTLTEVSHDVKVKMLKWACESLQVVRPGQTTTDRDRVASGTETSAQSVVMDKDSANKSLKRRLVEKILQEKGVSQNSDVDEEILKYLKYAPTDAEAEDGLLFWQTHGINYPTLRKVACYYLSVSASSVPVESMFSITGLILNNKRSSLSPIKLNYLSFIHDNCL